MIKIEEVATLGWIDDNNPDRYYFTIEKDGLFSDGSFSRKIKFVLFTPWHKKTDSYEGYFEGTEFRIKELPEDESKNPWMIFKGNLEDISELEVLMKQTGIKP